MRFHIEYTDGKGLDQTIHLISKNIYDAIYESQGVARTLAENKIYKWLFTYDMSEVGNE